MPLSFGFGRLAELRACGETFAETRRDRNAAAYRSTGTSLSPRGAKIDTMA
jgi:hypothetical protein